MTANYKYVIVGDADVGKTSIVRRFLTGRYVGDISSTVGVDFNSKLVDSGNRGQVLIHIWDTCGQERYRSLIKMYYRQAKCVFLVFDVTNRHSFINITNWLENVRKYADPPLIYLIGNKADLSDHSMVTYAEAHSFAQAQGLKYMETSAKTGDGIVMVFADSIHQLLSNRITPADPLPPLSPPYNHYCSC